MPRARTTLAALALAALGVLSETAGPGTGGARAVAQEVTLTFNSNMTKGPADAPVTIVEFSDYQ